MDQRLRGWWRGKGTNGLECVVSFFEEGNVLKYRADMWKKATPEEPSKKYKSETGYLSSDKLAFSSSDMRSEELTCKRDWSNSAKKGSLVCTGNDSKRTFDIADYSMKFNHPTCNYELERENVSWRSMQG
eukprot:TRINITY_DN11666_c0_g1_i1.p1 TRINITY_DN11666_c0_g1~~TRINITY_DN11666_c0_g1_i1.p1  ORF type:complete len:130 (+),score=29.19 TRINITY_DN11666_c0_g1_i1:61-450(+)